MVARRELLNRLDIGASHRHNTPMCNSLWKLYIGRHPNVDAHLLGAVAHHLAWDIVPLMLQTPSAQQTTGKDVPLTEKGTARCW